MTVRQIDKPDDHADVTVPSLLLSKLGLKHDVVRSSLLIADDFLNAFKKNVRVETADGGAGSARLVAWMRPGSGL